MDEGFDLHLVETAFFDGILEMPCLAPPVIKNLPSHMIPFSRRKGSTDFDEILSFYEYDQNFADVIRAPESFCEDFARFPAMTTPDCSVYRDSPLLVQMVCVYRSRAIGVYFQSNGRVVIPGIRRGDERSYTSDFLPEPFAFLGVPKHSIVSIGTYGCIKERENRFHFQNGLEAMMDYLEPETVLVYGSMPESIFKPYTSRARFIPYTDWTTRKHQKG